MILKPRLLLRQRHIVWLCCHCGSIAAATGGGRNVQVPAFPAEEPRQCKNVLHRLALAQHGTMPAKPQGAPAEEQPAGNGGGAVKRRGT